jgi:hypothetical protein
MPGAFAAADLGAAPCSGAAAALLFAVLHQPALPPLLLLQLLPVGC